jgi:deferrochelatase/peroxidase EfeB
MAIAEQENTRHCAAARRRFLEKLGTGSIGLALGSSMSAACTDKPSGVQAAASSLPGTVSKAASDSAQTACALAQRIIPFYGPHQAGIVTPAQRHIYLLVLDLHSDRLPEVREVFRRWTLYASRLTRGENALPYGDNPYLPPADTGEADSLHAYGLTLTFGVSPSFLRKLGLAHRAPVDFVDLPRFPREQLRPEWTGGDICIQSCADDPQVAFHAVRQLVRQARASVTPKWSQAGFLGYDDPQDTPRNLFGFKDGTANEEALKAAQTVVWVDEPDWLQGGTYMVVRKIQMHLETWDRTSLKGQEETFGRRRASGAPLGALAEFDPADLHAKDAHGKPVVPETAHMGLARRTGTRMLRRSYAYASGIDPRTGTFDAGLLFISFQRSPAQFIAVQSALGRVDRLNEYITHIGSGLFACFGGVQEGGYIGQALLEGHKG